MCDDEKFPGAYQPSGYGGKWLIPRAALDAYTDLRTRK
jgi:hypothetical protein